MEHDASDERRSSICASGLLLLICGSLILLGLSGPRLWTAQQLFPQIPFLNVLTGVPDWVDTTLAGAGLLLLVAACGESLRGIRTRSGKRDASFQRQRWLAGGLAIVLGSLILLDQHRCQPWAWQFLLMFACWIPARRPRDVLVGATLIAISLYLHSAFSKFDNSFVTSYGHRFVRAIGDAVGIETRRLSPRALTVLAACLPLGELLVGLGLCFRRIRGYSVLLAVFMHACLLLALGPFGLQHRPGVLIWNGYFIAQALLLFWVWAGRGHPTISVARLTLELGHTNLGAAVFLALVCVSPLLEPWGLIDHWPGWALYASKTGRVTVYVDVDARDRLPEEVRDFVSQPEPATRWCHLNIDAWSIESVGVPIYPQERFRLAVANAVGRQASLGDSLRIELRSTADRWTGKREAGSLDGVAAVSVECGRFLLGTRDRNWSSDAHAADREAGLRRQHRVWDSISNRATVSIRK